MGYAAAQVLLGSVHLTLNLRRQQIPLKTGKGRRTEGAAHFAPHLAGHANGVAVVIVHHHGLHILAIVQTKQIFHRIVHGRNIFFLNSAGGNGKPFVQFAPKILGQIGHLLKVLHTHLV